MKILFWTLAIVIIDQGTKLAVKGFKIPFLNFEHYGMYHGQRISVIGDFFLLTFVENPGMAFGIEINEVVKLLVSLFSIFASVGLIFYLYSVREKSFSLRISLALILGGAIGNLIDRVFYGIFYGYAPLFYGKVVDFLDFDFFNFEILGRTYDRWPIFNVADMAVSIGVFILLIFYNKHHNETTEKIEEKSEEETSPENIHNENDEEQNQIELNSIEENNINSETENKEEIKKDDESDKGKEIQI